jgi:hypothetical protein
VYRGFLALLKILRRARISGMKRAKISGTDNIAYPGALDPYVKETFNLLTAEQTKLLARAI